MSKQIDVLKMALEALKDNQHLVADNERHAYVMEYNSIIEKCEEALAQQSNEQVQPPPECQTEAEKTAFAFGWFKALESQRLTQQSNEQVKPIPMIVKTAPERIWLDIGFDPLDEDEISFNELVDATWSQDNATGYGIEYVRADIYPPVPTAQPKEPEQEPVAFPRQVGDSTWTVDTAFIWRVKHTIDPDTPHDFTPSEEQIETVLLALEKIPSNLYTTPPQRKPLAYVDLRRVANQCGLGANEVSAQAQAKVDNFARAIEAAHGIKEQQ